jgi:hypothetical protein
MPSVLECDLWDVGKWGVRVQIRMSRFGDFWVLDTSRVREREMRGIVCAKVERWGIGEEVERMGM